MKPIIVLDWGLRILAAAILLQTLYFKFSGAEESRHIFSTLGAEPWGRLGAGVAELLAAGLLLIPVTAGYGAALAAFVMLGAIGAHATRLGIVVNGDGGLLFLLALTVLLSSCLIMLIHRRDLARVWRVAAVAPGH